MRRARPVALVKSWGRDPEQSRDGENWRHTSRDAELQRAVTWNVHSSTRVQIRQVLVT